MSSEESIVCKGCDNIICICESEQARQWKSDPIENIISEMYYHIPNLPIASFIFGEEFRNYLELYQIHALLSAMDWDNKIE